MHLPKGFRLGVATASAQIEGGEVASNWNAFSGAGRIKDGSHVARANRHWEHLAEDVALLEELGIKDYRMSLEWARIEPSAGVFDETALAHYRAELELLKSKGIRPLITFYHFSHPLWFEALGSFTKTDNLRFFLRYVERCLLRLGDLCDTYCTLNEPNVYAVQAYLFKLWPPERSSVRLAVKVMNVFITAHLEAYSLIHRVRREQAWSGTRVSFAHHMRIFEAATTRFRDRQGVRLFDFLFQDGLMRACYKAEFRWPFINHARLPQGQYVDFIAINYYTRDLIRNFKQEVKAGSVTNDLGWEIYPEGLLQCAKKCHDCLPLDIVITENGICDNTDRQRSDYIDRHLEVIALSSLPIKAYYHWCFMDNFEWLEGESARFGLVHCDFETQTRTIKASGRHYAELIAALEDADTQN